MQISDLLDRAGNITRLVSDNEEKIPELETKCKVLEEKLTKELEKKTNEDRKEIDGLSEKIDRLKTIINDKRTKLDQNKVTLSQMLADIMKYREIRAIFEEQVKDEIKERGKAYTAVNNIYRELITDVVDNLEKKDGMSEEEKIIVFNYREYNRSINDETEVWYDESQKKEARDKYKLAIEELINRQENEIKEIAENLENNAELRRGIEKYFEFHPCDEKKELLYKNDSASKIELIKYIIDQYKEIPVRQDMRKREAVFTTAMDDVDEKIKELQKEYGNSKEEEKEIKLDNLNFKGTNVEKKTYTVTISQNELNKILENRKKQNEEKEVEEVKDQEIEKEEEKENRAKTFINSVKGLIKKWHGKEEHIEKLDVVEKDKVEEKLETETENKQKEDADEKDKTEEKLETEIDNKEKEEPSEELTENEQNFIKNNLPYVKEMMRVILADEINKEVDERTKSAEQRKDDTKEEKEQDNNDEIER